MKFRKLAVGASAVFLAGCAHAYDEGAFQGAVAQLELGVTQCKTRSNAHEFATVSAYAECHIAAREKFFHDIKFSQPQIVDAYAARVRLIASETDAGRYTVNAFVASANEADADLKASFEGVVREDAERRQRAALALAAMGQGLQNAAAQQRQYQLQAPPQPVYQPPVHCTSQTIGQYTYTNCQ